MKRLFAVPNLVRAASLPASDKTTAMTFLPWGGGRWPLQQDYDPTEAYIQGWDACCWVFACVSRIAQCVSSLQWTVKERRKMSAKWEPIPGGHDYETLLEYPNARLSRKTMVSLAVQHLLLPGEFYWKKVLIGNRVDELWPMNPLVIDPVASPDDWIKEYRVRRGTVTLGRTVPAEDMIHGLYVNPRLPFRGHSPFRALRETVAMDNDQVTWNRNLPRNGNVPRGAFVDPSMNDDNAQETKDRIMAQSGPEHAGKPMVLGGQAKWEKMALTPAEVDWLNTTNMTVKRICAVYNIPPAVIIPETATRGMNNSNLAESIRYLWEHSALPVADLVEEALNQSLFATREERMKFWIHYDTSGVKAMQQTFKEQLGAVTEGVKNGIRLNDMLSLMDIPIDPQPGGDQPVRSNTLIAVKLYADAGAPPAKKPSAAAGDVPPPESVPPVPTATAADATASAAGG